MDLKGLSDAFPDFMVGRCKVSLLLLSTVDRSTFKKTNHCFQLSVRD